MYTVVASTFEANLIGKFVLTAASDIPLAIEPIPAEGAVKEQEALVVDRGGVLNSHFFYRVCFGKSLMANGRLKRKSRFRCDTDPPLVCVYNRILGYSAMGCPSYGSYGKNPRHLLEVRELTTLR